MMKDIKGYEGLYAVTSCGKVWSYKRKIFLKPSINKDGYLHVVLWKNGARKNFLIHRLVLETYYPIEGMESLECNHCNEIKTDNYLNNLTWVSHKENVNYGTRNKRSAAAHCKKVRCIETGIIYDSIKEAAKAIGKSLCTLSNCLAGRTKTCGGFHWEFIEVN